MRASFLVVTLALYGCNNRYESDELHLAWEPPSGVRLVEAKPGLVTFSEGFEIRSLPTQMELPDEKGVEAFLGDVVKAANLNIPVTPASAKLGTLPIGAVARFEVKEGTNRTLIYVVPEPGETLIFKLTAPTSEYGKIEAQFERSFGSLKLRK